MAFTLGTAAQATGTAKSTILRAIKAGRISATRDDIGQWVIDPVELNRCFPLLAVPGAPPPQPTIEHDTTADALVAELRATLADLRSDRDRWREAHERGQAALAEALAAHTATQRLLPPPAATAIEQGAAPPATPVEQGATPAAPPKRWWWRRAG
jgi:hypothetical protein